MVARYKITMFTLRTVVWQAVAGGAIDSVTS